MSEAIKLSYFISEQIELNLSYMPFITNGGLFVPSFESYPLGADVEISLQLPNQKEPLKIEGNIVWITYKNALHHVLPGVGVQFTGKNAPTVKSQIENMLDKSVEVGGYTYGITDTDKRSN